MELKFKKEREKQKSQITYPYSRETQSTVNNNNNNRYNDLPVCSPIQQPITPPIQTYSSSPVYVTQPPPHPLQYQSQPNYYYSVPQQQSPPPQQQLQFVNPLSPISETPPQQSIYPSQQQPNMYYYQQQQQEEQPPPSFPQQQPLNISRHSKTADSQLLKIYSDGSPDGHDNGDDEEYNNLKLKQSYSQDSKPEEVNDKKKKYKLNRVVPEETVVINSMNRNTNFSQSQNNLTKTNAHKNSMQVQEVISLPPQTSSSTTSHTKDMLKSAILQSQYTDESVSRTRQNNESVDSFEVFSSNSHTHTDLKDEILKRQAFNNETPDSSSMDVYILLLLL